jgi:hypothetical protein
MSDPGRLGVTVRIGRSRPAAAAARLRRPRARPESGHWGTPAARAASRPQQAGIPAPVAGRLHAGCTQVARRAARLARGSPTRACN